MFQEYSEKNHPELPALTIIQGGGTVLREKSERKLQYDKSSLAWYKMVREDDFIVHLRSFEGGLEKSNHNGLISPAYHTFHGDEVDSRFYYPYFRSYEFIKHKLVPHVYGIRDGRSIDIDGMKTIEIPWTSYEEQKKIGDYIESLDTLITLHQRKCDETKKLKKFMLQKMFPKKDEKKPEIRFAGFTDDWEQRKLIDYLEVSSEKNRDNRFTKDDVLSVSGEYGIVNQIEFQGRSFAGASVSNYGVVENGDVVYTKSPLKSNPYGIIKTNKGIPGIVSTLYAVYKPKEITDSKFVQIYFELDSRMNSYMHPLVNKGAKNDMKVSAENALKGMVSFPKKDEQEMISLYFSYLDNLIALHQRKCDETKKLKKFMLQKMFPKKDEKKPEIRFAGFTDDWEQRKLVDVVDVRSGRDYKHLEEGDIPVYGTGGYMLSVNEALSDDEDAIGIGRKGTIDNPYILRAPFWTVDTLFYAVPLDKYDLNFVFDIFQNVNWKAKDESTGVPSLSKATINAVETLMPEYAEQKKIGEYFSNLDNFITLHQRKCDEIKKIKKFMLQNMFPQKG